jgi:aquaporin Z
MDYLVLIVEFFGTFLLLLSILASGNALVIGATLALVIFLTGSISGGHVNPAVSMTLWISGALTLTEFLAYITAQYAGGVAAYYAYNVLQ